MTANDFFRAANERWEEACCLYTQQQISKENNFWIGTVFLSVVAIECLYTAFFLYEHGVGASVPADHKLDGDLFTKISLSNSESVRITNAKIVGYWRHWPKDLRYLDLECLERRLIHKR